VTLAENSVRPPDLNTPTLRTLAGKPGGDSTGQTGCTGAYCGASRNRCNLVALPADARNVLVIPVPPLPFTTEVCPK
jgi:hypothetical protein